MKRVLLGVLFVGGLSIAVVSGIVVTESKNPPGPFIVLLCDIGVVGGLVAAGIAQANWK